jgi:hypothetical protein
MTVSHSIRDSNPVNIPEDPGVSNSTKFSTKVEHLFQMRSLTSASK